MRDLTADTHRPLVRVDRFELRLREPFRIAYETVTHAANLLARASDGPLQGFGEGAPIKAIVGEDQRDAITAARRWIPTGPLDSPPRSESLDSIGSPCGRCAVEGALLDLAARRADLPLATHLREAKVGAIDTSITVPLVEDDAIEPTLDRHRSEGFRIFKVKAGLGVDRDLARIARVRESAGPHAQLRVDPNQGWSRQDALRALPVLRDLGVAFLEQPLAREDMEGHAKLVEADQVPIMLDESVFSPEDAKRAIGSNAADMINIKLQKAGGILPGLQIADLAEEAGIPCMVGCMLESRVAITQAAHLVLAHPNIGHADLDGATFLAVDPVAGGATLREGRVHVSDRPGLGILDVSAA